MHVGVSVSDLRPASISGGSSLNSFMADHSCQPQRPATTRVTRSTSASARAPTHIDIDISHGLIREISVPVRQLHHHDHKTQAADRVTVGGDKVASASEREWVLKILELAALEVADSCSSRSTEASPGFGKKGRNRKPVSP